MEMVLIFTFCLILAGTDAVTTVTGYRGRSVQIKCSYTSGYENYNKYLCRGKCSTWNHKDVLVQSGSPAKDSRFSLYDDTTAKVFTVTITDLKREDEGTYWCGIEQTGPDKYTEVLLLVKKNVPAPSFVSATHRQSTQTYTVSTAVHPETTLSTIDISALGTVPRTTHPQSTQTHTVTTTLHPKTTLSTRGGTDAVTTVTGYRGRSVQIKCPYRSGYKNYNKYLCRGECPTWNHKDVPVQSGSPVKDSRFSLYDDTTAKVFTVTITDLRGEDEGTYWCAIKQIGRDKYKEILLLVKMDEALSTVSNTTHRQSKTHTHSLSSAVHPEISTIGKADYIMSSTGAMLFTFGVIIALYC
ncbi:polymeric immunoglobulin receptor-like [Clarias gariepinus]|uniref:uncharacterized protein LOC128506969 n=1 Tax=Clarias gariepinus TaxID=13013 RepID=UPI00234C1272|nr:uncharacterized protein LOC128506969 [Clarias gariepinus]